MAPMGAVQGRNPGIALTLTLSRKAGEGIPAARAHDRLPVFASELGDTQKQVSQFPVRHCERSEAIQGPQYDRLVAGAAHVVAPGIASSQGLLAMTDGSPLTRSIW